jgi:nucleotide-binding universal stress UspA family protein
MDVKKILWPTDLSDNSEKALPVVRSLAQQYGSEIHLLYVIEELAVHEPWYGEFDSEHVEKIHAWEEKKARERLDRLCHDHLEGCPLFVKHVGIGDPAEEILNRISAEDIDMVVMANRGRKGRFDFGSVTEKVVKNAAVPVSVVPAGAKGL